MQGRGGQGGKEGTTVLFRRGKKQEEERLNAWTAGREEVNDHTGRRTTTQKKKTFYTHLVKRKEEMELEGRISSDLNNKKEGERDLSSASKRGEGGG